MPPKGIVYILVVLGVGFLAFMAGFSKTQVLSLSIFFMVIFGTIFFWQFRLSFALLGISLLLAFGLLDIPHLIKFAGLDIGAAATLIVLPVSVFAFFVRRTIVQGLTMGALKD